MIKVVILEEANFLLNGLKIAIEQDNDISVCGLVEDGCEVMDICTQEKPDLLLMDIQTPNGVRDEIIRSIKKEQSDVKVLVFTTSDEQNVVAAALSSGADGYILKDIDDQKLISVIKNTISGICSVSAKVSNIIREWIPQGRTLVNLSQKEEKILYLIVNGNSNKEIAEALYCSEGTIKNDVARILKKLKLATPATQ